MKINAEMIYLLEKAALIFLLLILKHAVTAIAMENTKVAGIAGAAVAVMKVSLTKQLPLLLNQSSTY